LYHKTVIMKKLILLSVAVLGLAGFTNNANAQLLKKLKEKVAGNNGSSQTGSSPSTIKEEKAGKVLNTYTLKGKIGDLVIDITENDEIVYDNRTGVSGTVQYLRTSKSQFTVSTLTFNNSNQLTKGEKTVISKKQLANCMQAIGNEGNIELRFYLKNDGILQRLEVGEDIVRDLEENYASIRTTSAEKANSIQSKILDKEIKGAALNRFTYITGDGTTITTLANSFWGYRDGALYFESLENEKALRVTYFEINYDIAFHKTSYLVKVTTIPASAIGDYKKITVVDKDALLPLIKPVNKVIYKEQEKPTTEEIQDNFKITANSFNSEMLNNYYTIVGKQLGANAAKFKKEVQEPSVAAKIKAEKDFEEKYYTKSIPSASSNSQGSSTSTTSSSNATKAKSDVVVKLINKSDNKLNIIIYAPTGSGKSIFDINPRSTNEKRLKVGSKVSVNGTVVLTITADMDDTDQIIMR
jgi:hypothetical protein